MKTLYLLRHAQAKGEGADDHARPLTHTGIKAAEQLGIYLREQGICPELVYCSTASRTRETFACLRQACGMPLPVRYEDALYLASAEQIVKVMRGAAGNPASLLIIGHNPDLHHLAVSLAAEGEGRLREELAASFPPCAFAAIALPAASWAEAGAAPGTLTRLVLPRQKRQPVFKQGLA